MDQEMQAQMTVYLIRHGQTELNATGRLRGRLDVALDATGLKQAEALGLLFQGVALQRVIVSPLQRARQTALPVAGAAGLSLEIEQGFNDRDYASWAGEPRSAIEARFGAVDKAPGVETWPALTERVHQAFLRVVSTSGNGPIAIVAHDAVNKALLGALVPGLGDDPRAIPQCTGCWNKLVRRGGDWQAPLVDIEPGDRYTP